MIVACVGARALDQTQLKMCGNIGGLLGELGHEVSTGAAPGADQAFAEACLDAGGRVHLWLPWTGFEKAWRRRMEGLYNDMVTATALSRVSTTLQARAAASMRMLPYGIERDSVKRLMGRNFLIVECADAVIAWPGSDAQSGGTRQAMRIGESLDLPVLDLRAQEGIKPSTIKEFLRDAA